MADPYAANPLATEFEDYDPQHFAAVSAVVEPPKMFAGGTSDTPAFTASGIDPQLLLKLPVGIRHAAAANPDITQVLNWFESYAHIPDAVVESDGLTDARYRMQQWFEKTDLDPRSPEEKQADLDAEYEQYERMMDPRGMTQAEHQAAREQRWADRQALERQTRQAGGTVRW